MTPSNLLLRLGRSTRNLLPVTITVALVLVGVARLQIPGYAVVAPSLPLMAVYYWTVFRPDLMPRLAVFGIGLLQDALAGLPLGVNAVVLLLLHAVVSSQRRFLVGKPFWVFWWGFMLVAAAAVGLTWGIVSVLRGAFIAPSAAVFHLILTIAAFPVLCWFLFRTQRVLRTPS